VAHDQEAHVRTLVGDLLAAHPPEQSAPSLFWGAQYDLGLAWVHFPAGFGGLGIDPDLQLVVDAELVAAGAPSNARSNLMGVGMAGPTIVAHGTEEQRRLLRPLFTCEHIWCQLFSEPGAGSDLASLATMAVRDGDHWVVNGQKVWTTLAHVAQWGMLLARTDPDVPKHQGLTYFLVDMSAPGVEVRPLRQLTGEAEFNEVYLTDVRIPDAHRVGEVNDGWRIALTTLMSERVTLGRFGNQPRGSGPIGAAMNLWSAHPAPDPVMRDRLISLWIESEVMRLTAIRAEQARQIGTPGPEGAVGKLAMSVNTQRVFDFCMDLRGAESLLISNYDMVRPTSVSDEIFDVEAAGRDFTKAYLTTLASTIGGGTTEIGKNVIAERVLGLPPDIRTDKDLPWRDVPRN
jgi:alkylation response protein AidB-like acyl-CoA dehydrogenase